MPETTYNIEVPENIDMDDLELVIAGLQSIHKAAIAEVTVLRTDDFTCARALEYILNKDATVETAPAVPQASKNGKGKKQRRVLPAWRDEGTGETFSTQSLNKRLADHALPLGTKLHHPKHGNKVVVAGADDDGPDQLVDRGEWEESHE